MNKMSAINLTAVALAALALAACHTDPPQQPVQPHAEPQQQQAKQENPRDVTPRTAEVDPLDNPTGELAKRSVYFDFDSYSVKSDYEQLVAAHAKYLAAHKSRNVKIEGNTDERGTAEYNLALGQKRAEAVRKALVAQGAADSQLESVSYGKEKPKAEGHDESAWSQNRRADLSYAAK